MWSKTNFQEKDETDAAKQTIRSIIDGRILDHSTFAVSIVRTKGKEHAFLVLEGRRGKDEYLIFRTDLFLNNDSDKNISGSKVISGSLFKSLMGSSQSSHGQAFIRIKEITFEELEGLAKISEYQSWELNLEQAECLLNNIEQAGNTTLPYHMAGNHSSSSVSTCTSGHQNCLTWCLKILRLVDPKEEKIKLGKKWHLINKPSKRIAAIKSLNCQDETEKGLNVKCESLMF